MENVKTRKLTLVLTTLLVLTLSLGSLTGCSSSASSKKDSKKSSNSKKSKEKPSEKDKAETEAKDSATKEDKEKEKESEKETVAKTEDKKAATEKETKKESKKELSHAVPSADVIWGNLMKGNKRFIAGIHTNVQFVSIRRELAKGQHPNVIILGCADSRVPPELLFDKNLGDLFVIRTAGNVADPVALGSIEYAVEHLHASILVVLGHEGCGAVAAALTGEKMPSSNLNSIVDKIRPAFEGSEACALGSKGGEECIELNVSKSAKDVQAKSSIIRDAVAEGKLTVIRAVYNLETGEVKKLN